MSTQSGFLTFATEELRDAFMRDLEREHPELMAYCVPAEFRALVVVSSLDLKSWNALLDSAVEGARWSPSVEMQSFEGRD